MSTSTYINKKLEEFRQEFTPHNPKIEMFGWSKQDMNGATQVEGFIATAIWGAVWKKKKAKIIKALIIGIVAFVLGLVVMTALFYNGYRVGQKFPFHLEWRHSLDETDRNCLYWFEPTSETSARLHKIICINNHFK